MTTTDQAPGARLADLAALYPRGAPVPLRIIRLTQKETPGDLVAAWRQGIRIHAVFEMRSGLKRAWRLALLKWHFTRHRFSCQLVGLSGSVERPGMVVPLGCDDILQYVNTVAFRGTDSFGRVLLKRLAGFLPGSWTWADPLVLIASPAPEKFDRFVLLTGDRQIAFLFRSHGQVPWAVCKAGAREDILAEQRNHSLAVQILGRRVPALLETRQDGQTASITLEYVRERFLGNVVAACLFRKRQVFIREALGHLDFCREIYRLLAVNNRVEFVAVTEAEVKGLWAGIDEFLRGSTDAEPLRQALVQTIGVPLPRLIQHGDFCVRNVLMAGGERGRVLIDWEDMQERRWPLVDFVLLRLSLKEVYGKLFNVSLEEMTRLPELAQGLRHTETDLAKLLDIDPAHMAAAQWLSLACLCRQNLRKGRKETAMAIFRELTACLRTDPNPVDNRVSA